MVSVMYNSIPISLLLAVAQFSDHYNYCLVSIGVRQEHVLSDCDELTNRCIRCFEKGHGRTSCSYARPYELNGTCSSCWLPGNRHGQSLPWHKDTFGGACRANEEFKHVFLAAWRQHKLPAEWKAADMPSAIAQYGSQSFTASSTLLRWCGTIPRRCTGRPPPLGGTFA